MPKYEEYNPTEMKEFDSKAFKFFEDECGQNIERAIAEMETHHVEFSGHMVKGKKEGKGGYRYKETGDFYYGGWQNDQRHGYGIIYFGNKGPQELTIFRNTDFMSAELLLKVSKPTVAPLVFKGMWQRDMMNGDGIIKLSNDLVILAQFKDGVLKDTHMQVVYPNGDIYVGAHKSGVKQGLGTYTYNDEAGARYEGEWKDNMKHGKGELVFRNQDGARFTGRFAEDQIVTGEYVDALGNSFKSKKHPDEGKTLGDEKPHELSGRFEKGRLSGYGQADYTGGDQYIGVFKDGKRSGQGSMIFNQYNDVIMDYQQARFDGEWQRNKRYG